MTTVAKTTNYSPVQEQFIRDAAEFGTLDLAAATVIASNPLMNEADGTPRKPRSIVAKISRMGLPYARKVAVSKTGEPVANKTAIVAEIAKFVKGNLDGLDVAPKPALVAVRNALTALAG